MIVQEILDPLVGWAPLSRAGQEGAISGRPRDRLNVTSPFMGGVPVFNDSE